MQDLISIIVPIYNVEKYLDKCLQSITSQTYKNLQIILINDGSTDSSLRICENFALNDERICIVNQESKGVSEARNTGIREAKGAYITFIDSDDVVESTYIQYLYDIIKENNDISVCKMKEIYGDGDDDINKDGEESVIKQLNSKEAIEIMLYQREFDNSLWGKMYKKELFSDVVFPKGKLYEDMAVIYDIFLKTDKIIFGSKINYYYRVRQNSIMTTEFSSEKMELINFTERMVKNVSEKFPDLYMAAIRRYVYSNFRLLGEAIRCKGNNSKEENILINNIKRYSKIVLKNPNADKKDKIAIILLLLNKKLYKKIFLLYKK